LFEKINKIDKPLGKLTKIRKKGQLVNSDIKKEDIIPDASEIQRSIWEYFENLYSTKLEN
jgi:hypothetical protein